MTWTRLHLKKDLRILLCVVPLFFFSSPSLWAQNTAPICEPSSQVKAAIDRIEGQKQASSETDYEFWRSRQAATNALLHQYPNDFFVQRFYVYEMMGPDPSTAGYPSEHGTLQVIADYRALHEQHPDDSTVEYLYATTLINRDTPTAIRLLEEALRKNPSSPPPRLDLVRIYTSPNFLDHTKAKSHLSTFLAACPASLAGYGWLRGFGDDDLIRKSSAQLRSVIGKRADADAVWEYPTLWGLEFKSHPRSDYDAVRSQVAADLTRIRALKLQNNFGWWYVLDQGYQLIGDQEQAKWAASQRDNLVQSSDSSTRCQRSFNGSRTILIRSPTRRRRRSGHTIAKN